MNNVERFRKSAVLFPVFLLILTTIYLAEALSIRSQFGGDTIVGPRFMPILMAIIMYVALIVVLVGELRRDEESASSGSFLRPLLVVVATGIYIALFRPLGYVPATLGFVIALFLIFDFERRRPAFFAFYVIAVTALFYGLFAGVFGVRLPPVLGGF
ncbi:tripartite tricarboxylate transporter TctB family protein [Halomonas sp. TRM85114]|uniref:tripartite tricarboxylate transporter TctB family protein n=1 Tax=Halomonas jincaotanensis TaxID=2810616 RepID=UPI001BD38C60|nr:tripartite tricarboxylate transporter TctB family protein [Halomonas jincaotanensis]MBS9404375.1 tripartite tricarboxylate transporter TctB family protein [Halomonas jincaotanensis]